MGSVQKALVNYIEGQWLSGSEIGVHTERTTSSPEQHVYLKEPLADTLCHLDMGFGNDFLDNKWSHLVTSEETVFSDNNKIQTLK